MNIRRISRPARGSRGIVLPLVLIMLLVLTIASLVVVGQISSQTRMASNAAVDQVSLQAAEALLRNVSDELNDGNISVSPGSYQVGTTPNSTGMYQYNPTNYLPGTNPPWNVAADWDVVTNQVGEGGNAALCPNPPTPANITFCGYMIEKLPSILGNGNSQGNPLSVFRITARVIGPNGQGTVMLQTLFTIPQ